MAGGAVLALNGLAPRPKRAEAPSCARTAWPDPLCFRHNQGDARATSSGTLMLSLVQTVSTASAERRVRQQRPLCEMSSVK
jgi:hypothetical protein